METLTDLPGREMLVQRIVELAELDRRKYFLLGEAINNLLVNDNNVGTAKNTAAEALGCSRRYIDQLVAVFRTFGWEHWFPDVPWSMYRACIGTDNAVYWLNRALAGGWSVRDLRIQYAKETGKKLDDSKAERITLRAKGRVQLSPGVLVVRGEIDGPLDNFTQGSVYRVEVKP